MGIDRAIVDWVIAHRRGWLKPVFRFVTDFGVTPGVFLALAVAIIIGVVRSARTGQRMRVHLVASLARVNAVLVGSLLSGLIVTSLKVFFARARPPLESRWAIAGGYAMPSGHASKGAVLAILLCSLWTLGGNDSLGDDLKEHRYVRIGLASLFAFLVGVSRVVLAVHWPTDVIAGWVVGAAIAMSVTWTTRRLFVSIVEPISFGSAAHSSEAVAETTHEAEIDLTKQTQ